MNAAFLKMQDRKCVVEIVLNPIHQPVTFNSFKRNIFPAQNSSDKCAYEVTFAKNGGSQLFWEAIVKI